MAKIEKNLRTVGRCIKSAADNWELFCWNEADNVLSDIEVDLETALAEVRAYRRHVAHVAVYSK